MFVFVIFDKVYLCFSFVVEHLHAVKWLLWYGDILWRLVKQNQDEIYWSKFIEIMGILIDNL